MYQAIWNGVALAESDKTVKLEGNQYFPPDSIDRQYFKDSQNQTVCPWKGVASYYDIEVDGKVNKGAAWTYPAPSKAAAQIKNHVAFWGGVKVKKVKPEAVEGEVVEEGGLLGSLKRIFAG
jgi:uncharacterized protein (DUF427 family)